MAPKLRSPEQAQDWLRQRYDAQQGEWLGGGGSWPLVMPLGDPTEPQGVEDVALLRRWRDAWHHWTGGGEVEWRDRQWRRTGTQTIPHRWVLQTASDVARVVGDGPRFALADRRHARLVQTWAAMAGSRRVAKHFDALAGYSDEDFERLFALLAWLDHNRASGLYLRQLPVVGMDTKWCETRQSLITDLVLAMRGLSEFSGGFDALTGLRPLPWTLRFRVLCPLLRHGLGGLEDVQAPIEQVAALKLAPRCVLIVENLQTGLALPDLPGCVVFMRLGKAVTRLADIPWVSGVPTLYWGDIDTHGFVILGYARATLPEVCSIAMDETTLLENLALCVRDLRPNASELVPHLTDAERAVLDNLRAGTWGLDLRLEQERLLWQRAVATVRQAVEARVGQHTP